MVSSDVDTAEGSAQAPRPRRSRRFKIILALLLVLLTVVLTITAYIGVVVHSTWRRLSRIPVGISSEEFEFPSCGPVDLLGEYGGPLRTEDGAQAAKSPPDHEDTAVASWSLFTIRSSDGSSIYSLDLWRFRWVNGRLVESRRILEFRRYFCSIHDTE